MFACAVVVGARRKAVKQAPSRRGDTLQRSPEGAGGRAILMAHRSLAKLRKTSAPKPLGTVWLLGSGAVLNSWDPIIAAIQATPLDEDGTPA
jgi:hypothetical protein